MNKTALELDWNHGNTNKCTKHGLSTQDIEKFFQSKFYVLEDPQHSQIEKRYIAVGRADNGRPMLVGFTFRIKLGKQLIRPISARYMHKKEAERYEKETSKIKD